MKLILILTLSLMASAAGAARAEALRDDAHVTKMLVGAQIGDILRQKCPKVSARMFVVLGEMSALKTHATSKGHSDGAIRAFLNDAAEKQRIRALADDYLQNAGANPSDAASYCAVARREVDSKTVAGRLIKVDK